MHLHKPNATHPTTPYKRCAWCSGQILTSANRFLYMKYIFYYSPNIFCCCRHSYTTPFINALLYIRAAKRVMTKVYRFKYIACSYTVCQFHICMWWCIHFLMLPKAFYIQLCRHRHAPSNQPLYFVFAFIFYLWKPSRWCGRRDGGGIVVAAAAAWQQGWRDDDKEASRPWCIYTRAVLFHAWDTLRDQ